MVLLPTSQEVQLHNFFFLDIECNSTLENGTVQVTKLRKTDVIVIDEFSMLDYYLFHTAEGLCRKFAKHRVSRLPWGGRHVIMLGDPAQLPAVEGVIYLVPSFGVHFLFWSSGRSKGPRILS